MRQIPEQTFTDPAGLDVVCYRPSCSPKVSGATVGERVRLRVLVLKKVYLLDGCSAALLPLGWHLDVGAPSAKAFRSIFCWMYSVTESQYIVLSTLLDVANDCVTHMTVTHPIGVYHRLHG